MSAVSACRNWALRRCLIGKRILPALIAAMLPAIITAIGASAGAWSGESDAFADFGRFIAPLCLYFVLPMLCMFTVLPTVGELYETGAIGYVWTRPAARWKPLIGIHQGATIALLLLAFAGIAVNSTIMFLADRTAEVGAIDWCLRALGLWSVMAIGGAAYCAMCLFLAVWSKRSALWSIGLLIGWGAIVGALPGNLRNTSPHRYLFGLLRDWCGLENTWSGIFIPDSSPPSTAISLLVLLATTCLFLAGAYAASIRRDVL